MPQNSPPDPLNAQAPPVHAGGRAQRRPGFPGAPQGALRESRVARRLRNSAKQSPRRRLYPGVDRKPSPLERRSPLWREVRKSAEIHFWLPGTSAFLIF